MKIDRWGFLSLILEVAYPSFKKVKPFMETQTTICEWAEKTFGPVNNPNDLLKRALQETTELSEAMAKNNTIEIGKETADIVILLHRLLDQYGLDLSKEVNEKMTINRARKWELRGDGTGSHIK